MKHLFPVSIDTWNTGHIVDEIVEAVSLEKALEEIVIKYGNTSAYRITIEPKHPYVLERQRKLWKS